MNHLWRSVAVNVQTDVTWRRVTRTSVAAVQAFPHASARYVLETVPIVEWLPAYRPRWLVNDVVAGLTLGLMLIPQSLSYAKIAGIPVQYGLMSSWLPSAIYAFMGSTKDISVGPTSLIGLLTHEAVKDLPEYTPSQVASAMAMMMGIYGMVLGFLKLGFLLEFISLPILSGFISAVAITIGLGQVPSLLGETNVGSGTANQIHDIFAQLPHANGYDCAIGFTAIVFITILEKAGKAWGKENKVIWFLSITRAFLTLVLYTGIGYAVNHHRNADDYLFAVVKVKGNGIEHPRMPSGALLDKVAGRGISIFIGAAVEHTAIARAFGIYNNYEVDQSQELRYLGVTNFFNAFFSSMGVGGAMSRTAVNSACNVKSPLSGFVTTAVVLISIFKLVGTLYWIPKAALAAIIICAVAPLVHSPRDFYRYWRTSLSDWISSMIAFWVTLFVSTQVGLGASVGFNIVYFMLKAVFANVHTTSSGELSELVTSIDSARDRPRPADIPSDVRVFRFSDSVFYPNSYRLKTQVMDIVQTCHAPAYSSLYGTEADRNWSVAREKKIRRLRHAAGITDPSMLPPITLLILDYTNVNYIDTTAVRHMKNLFSELKKYAGDELEIWFAAMSENVRSRFERAGWKIVVHSRAGDSDDKEDITRVFPNVRDALLAPRRRNTITGDTEATILKATGKDDDLESIIIAHRETTGVSTKAPPYSEVQE